MGELISKLTTDLTALTRQELALAKVEFRDEAKKAGKAAGLLGGAGFAGWMLALFASLAVMWALGEAMHLAWAALIVTAVWGIAGAVLFQVGRQRLRQVDPKPDQTVDSMKEDAKWLTARNN
ncbi:phage holin family protein [Kribbella sp. NBC_01245]|uniref:phage holin family protein n=1 Tax=Kribbella sp. NBC_01245 TaxID=2903578 RepID=UPI002E28EF88|nr:phage holin family protein [Kribbella sp. NBC_01245]